jgi:uroporphyrin-III C-methyltransferase/precorrin-2 dehydrogenase/sirohydrochlorin ferrochelatase
VDYLPLYARVNNQSCLVVGGGEIAARKIALLCRANASVTIVAPDVSDATRELVDNHQLELITRQYRSDDIRGHMLVVSATDIEAVNRRVFEDCVAARVLVNSVDMPALSNVIFPALIDRSPVIVAVSTGGSSPTLARIVRSWIEARLPARLGRLAEFIAARRSLIKDRLQSIPERQVFWERIINGSVAEQIFRGDEAGARAAFDDSDNRPRNGFVALVGAGPGDPELLTLKALRLLQSADVVLYDNLVNRGILDYVRRDAQLTYVGKKWRAASTRQEQIHELMLEHARDGLNVVRLKGGDPFIFGRGGEELEALTQAGIECFAVPGITAASGTASYAGIPLTHRDASQSVRFVTGHRASNRTNLDWPELAKPDQTIVIYMGLPGLEQIFSNLMLHGASPELPAAVIEQATLPSQRVVIGTLSNLAAKVRAAEMQGPTTIVIGEVVAHRVSGIPAEDS